GEACGCDADCQSGFCADGVCCSTACAGTCKACNVQGSPGICSWGLAAPAASSCGLDGTCDGSGACRQHVAGTVCKPGTCSNAAVVDINVCDGRGHGKPRPGA